MTFPGLKIQDGVLKFAWDRPARQGRGGRGRPSPAQHWDYEIRYVNGKLEGRMMGGKNLTFTGERGPVIDEHDDGTWAKGTPIVLFNGKDLKGWTGIRSENADGWTVVNGLLTSKGHADDLVTKTKGSGTSSCTLSIGFRRAATAASACAAAMKSRLPPTTVASPVCMARPPCTRASCLR